jgi:methylated-DNA-protein-cysteine methyltransferase-like protein
MSPFTKNVLRIVSQIPPGKVTSYGAVAAMAGQPRAARGVGWIMNGLGPDSDIPWWRVVNKDGGISTFKLPTGTGPLQLSLLESEGVVFDAEKRVEDDSYWWRPDLDEIAHRLDGDHDGEN